MVRLGWQADLLDEFTAEKVCVVPGSFFRFGGIDAKVRSPYVRISFAFAPDEVLVEGMRRLGNVLRRREAAAGRA